MSKSSPVLNRELKGREGRGLRWGVRVCEDTALGSSDGWPDSIMLPTQGVAEDSNISRGFLSMLFARWLSSSSSSSFSCWWGTGRNWAHFEIGAAAEDMNEQGWLLTRNLSEPELLTSSLVWFTSGLMVPLVKPGLAWLFRLLVFLVKSCLVWLEQVLMEMCVCCTVEGLLMGIAGSWWSWKIYILWEIIDNNLLA